MNSKYFEKRSKNKRSMLAIKNDCSLFENIKIQTNQKCTRRCQFCYYGNDIETDSDLELEASVVYKLLDELALLDFSGRIGLFEINEPLTDQRIYDFLEYAIKHIPNAWHMLITNGDLLTEKNLERLNEVKLDQLCVSVYDAQTLAQMRKLKKKRLRLFKIVELMDLRKEIFVDNRAGNINYKYALPQEKPIKAGCERVHKLMYVRPTGKVVSCFGDFYEINVVGDVYRQSLQEIWFGKRFTKLRDKLNKKDRAFSKLCSKCNYPGLGGFFKKPT